MVNFRATGADGISTAISPFSERGSDLQSRGSDVLMSNRYNVMRSNSCQRHFLYHTPCMNQDSSSCNLQNLGTSSSMVESCCPLTSFVY